MSYWNLYWVESDGLEDCFIVARNSRSACRIERDMNGFDDRDLHATKIMRIPKAVESSYKKTKEYKEHTWPSYISSKTFFEDMGAQFRMIDNQEEMLLEDVVYAVEEYAPCGIIRQRSIGQKSVSEINESELGSYPHHEEDLWHEPEIHLITTIGICVVRCQQIEHYIAHSFLFGGLSEKSKEKFETLEDLRKDWKKKTLGNMLRSIEESWEIHPILKAALELFLNMRNKLVHGITTSERYDIDTYWGQQELLGFLTLFDVHSRIIKKAFRGSFYASLDFGAQSWGIPDSVPEDFLDAEHIQEDIDLFVTYFTPK